MSRPWLSLASLSLLVHAGACAHPSAPPELASAAAPEAAAAPEPAPESAATAEPVPTPIELTLAAKSGSTLAGEAVLTETTGGVKITLSVRGISPGEHGAHVHEKGDCSAADGKSAGDHFNPGAHAHGMPAGSERHLGDLGNLRVTDDGEGRLEITVADANLIEGDANSFLHRAIVIHEKVDDGGQPTGNAGGRIGCGVIER